MSSVAVARKRLKLTVTAGKAPGGKLVTVAFRQGMTVSTALRKAGVKSLKGHALQRNGKRARPATRVKPGDKVLAVGKIRGG